MIRSWKDKFQRLPIFALMIRLLSSIKLPGLEGFSVYDLIRLYVMGIVRGALTTRASAIAFSFFTAIFPFLLFVITLIPFIPVAGFQTDFLNFLESFLPSQAADFFNDAIFNNIQNSQRGGVVSTVFVVSMVLMANGVNALFSGFESSYHQNFSRNFFKQYIYAFGVALILTLLLILTVVLFGYIQIYIVHPLYSNASLISNLKSSELFWIETAKYIVIMLLTYLAMATLYYFGTRQGRESRFFSIGALFSTLLIGLTSYLFGIYIENFSKYNELYGSIGGLLILLFFLWLNANIILLGYELNASLQRLKLKCK